MKRVAIVLALLPSFGCATFLKHSELAHDQTIRWTTGASFTTADVRVITQRIHPVTGKTVVCTEPNPDVAKAFANAFQLNVKGGNGTVNASLGMGGNAAEAVAELVGRSTALLGLRDGLYRACEAYANGAIGADAYALVLGRYSQLMTTLFLAQDITGVAAAEGRATAAAALQAIAPQLSSDDGGTAKPAPAGGGETGGGAPAGKDAAGGGTTRESHGNASAVAKARPSRLPASCGGASGAEPSCGVDTAAPTSGADASCASDGEHAAGDADPPVHEQHAAATATNEKSAPRSGLSATAVLALTRMNEDYLNLDLNLLHSVVIACINENDPTRVHARTCGDGTPHERDGAPCVPAASNRFLDKMCGMLQASLESGDPETLEALTGFARLHKQLVDNIDPYIRPVDPTAPVRSRSDAAARPSAAAR